MKTQLPIDSRYRFPLYADAADYLARTGRRATWNPDLPERHWESLGVPGPFFCIPEKQGDPLFEFTGFATFVNMPAKPALEPWTAPAVNVTVNGIAIADPFFATAEERDALIHEINAAANANGSPRLTSFSELTGFRSDIPYTYGPNEPRRNWQLKDSTGKFYCVGELIASKYRIGKNPSTPTGAWTYTENGWFWKIDQIAFSGSIAPPRAGSIRPCLDVRPGERIIWAPTSLPGVQNLVVEVDATGDAAIASGSQLDRIEAKLDTLLAR